MGCGSSRNSKAQPPSKKNGKITTSLLFDPLTTLSIINIGKLQAKIQLTSGETEAQQNPIYSSRLYSTDNFITIILSNLANFTEHTGKYYPKIAYTLKEKKENVSIVNNEDHSSLSTLGIDLSNQEIKVLIPLKDVKPKNWMSLNLSIIDGKANSNEEIKAIFLFLIIPERQRNSEKQETSVGCQGFEGFSINQLNVNSLTVLNGDEEELKEPYVVEAGKPLYVRMNGLQGLVKKGEFVTPGCSLLTLNHEGKEVFFKENLFPEDNEYHEEDLSEFKVSIDVGGEQFKPLEDYWLNVRIWDNRGIGQLGFKVKYQGSNKLKARAIVYEVKDGGNPGEATVKCKGETGLLKRMFIFIDTIKEKAEAFKQNLEKSVELLLEFEENHESKKQDILAVSKTNDGVEKKSISWKLLSVTSVE